MIGATPKRRIRFKSCSSKKNMLNPDAAALLHAHEGGLATAYENITDTEAVAIVGEHFGIDCTVLRFATEKDDTFRVDCPNGRQFVLKVANPSEAELEIEFQIEILRHVAAVAPSLPVPRVHANLKGQNLFRVQTASGVTRFARLMTFLPGIPLARTTSKPHERERIGALLAQLRRATAGFSHPADQRVLAWDVKHLSSLRHLLKEVPNARHRDALSEAMERYSSIEGRLAACRTQVLHNDFNTNNIVVNHDSPDFVTGIIDFGDAVRTAIAVDVSTALMNQLPHVTPADLTIDIFDAARDVVRGYRRHADLTEVELELIPHLSMARVVTRALLTTWRAQLFPENSEYILRNTGQGWGQLEWFLSRSNSEISGLLLPPHF